MTLIEWSQLLGNFGEFFGAIAVVATLIFLSVQVRHSKQATEANTTIHIASTTADSYLRWTEINDLLSSDIELVKLWVRIFDNQSLDDFDPTELFRITLSIRSVIQRLAAIHQQHENGLIDDEFWQNHRIFFASWLKVKGLSEWWELEKQSSLFTDSFILELDQTKGFTMSGAGQMVRDQST